MNKNTALLDHLSYCILITLPLARARDKRDICVRDIAKKLRADGRDLQLSELTPEFRVFYGRVYKSIRRLEAAGLAEATTVPAHESEDRRTRLVVTMTEAGHEQVQWQARKLLDLGSLGESATAS